MQSFIYRIIACIDKNGDTLKEGFFLMGNNQLKFCRIYNNGKKARIESRGQFSSFFYYPLALIFLKLIESHLKPKKIESYL